MAEHPGMVAREEWAATDVHKASDYWCVKCGMAFTMPHDFYDHTDEDCQLARDMHVRLEQLDRTFNEQGYSHVMLREARHIASVLAVPPPTWARTATSATAQLAELGEDEDDG